MGIRIKDIFRHSATYGLAPVLGRAAGFLLLPLYTNFLSPADYGTLELVSLVATFVNIFVGLEILNSVVRLYHAYDAEQDRREVLVTALVFTAGLTSAGMVLLSAFRDRIALAVFGDAAAGHLLSLALWTVVCTNVTLVLYGYLQARKMSALYTGLWIAELSASLVLNVMFVAWFRLGVAGILWSGLLVNGVFALGVAAWVVGRCGLRFSVAKMWEMVAFGAPLIGVSLSAFVMSAADRAVLSGIGSLTLVGLYSLANRFATVLNVFFVTPFALFWNAERFAVAKQEDSRKIIARLFTYFVVGTCFVGLGLSVWMDDVIRLMTARQFWSAAAIGPVLVLGYGLSGVFGFLTTGAMIRMRTAPIGLLSTIGAIGHVALCTIAGKVLLALGVAWANVATYAFLTLGAYVLSQRYYPIPFELGRIVKAIAVAGVLFGASRYLGGWSPIVGIAAKVPLVLGFPLVLAGIGFLDAGEKRWLVTRATAVAGKLQLAMGAQ